MIPFHTAEAIRSSLHENTCAPKSYNKGKTLEVNGLRVRLFRPTHGEASG